jgi:hypothetical protein
MVHPDPLPRLGCRLRLRARLDVSTAHERPTSTGGRIGRRPVTAVQLLRQFKAPGGVATTIATTNADTAVTYAAQHSRAQLVNRFTVHGPRAIQELRTTVGAELGIHGGDLRHRWTVTIGHDRLSWRYDCYI